jgi:AcrR family transcriptional regulator
MSDTADIPTKVRRRGEILDAAFAEFSAKGYAGASMEAIARRARASKETLYAWFGNKETLLVRLFESRMAGVTDRVAAAAARDPSPANVLPVIAEDIMRLNLAIAPLNHSVEVGGTGEATARLIGRSIAEERQRFAGYLLRCRAEGYIAFDDDPLEIASMFVVMAGGEWGLRLGTGMIAELTDEMIEDHAQRVTRIFLRGLAPPTLGV